MFSIIAALGGIGTVLSLAVWALKAYAAKKEADRMNAERQAGANASQVEANNAEIKRNEMAVTAGNAVDGVRDEFDNADRSKRG